VIRQLFNDLLDVIDHELAQQTVLSFADLVITHKLKTIQFYRSDVVQKQLRMTAAALQKNIEREKFPAFKEGKIYWIPVTFVRQYRAERMHLTDDDLGLPLEKILACQRKLVRYEAEARAQVQTGLQRAGRLR
jgi:galactose-1-phosphate uridylyltransferase